MDISKIGKRIFECRKSMHITQEQAAELLNISIKHYSEIERGVTGLSFDLFIKICEIYNTSADFLLFGEQNSIPPHLYHKLTKCSLEKRERILLILSSILEL